VWDFGSFSLQLSMNIFFSDLQPALVEFVKEQTIKYYDDVSEKLIQSAKNGDIDVEDVIKTWEKAFKQVLCKGLKL
jgi:hypothetical protein